MGGQILGNSRKKVIGLVTAVFGTAALLGGTLGAAAARDPQNLSAGSNFVGGPLEAMTPEKFTSCLPDSWNSIYIWDAPTQQWKHYVNPEKVPDYVNSDEVGGISAIPRFAGLAILMDSAATGVVLPNLNSDTCG